MLEHTACEHSCHGSKLGHVYHWLPDTRAPNMFLCEISPRNTRSRSPIYERFASTKALPRSPLPSYASPLGAHANKERYCALSVSYSRAAPPTSPRVLKVNSQQQLRKQVIRQVFLSAILSKCINGDRTTASHSIGLLTWRSTHRGVMRPSQCPASQHWIWPRV